MEKREVFDGDIPGTRYAIKTVATKFNIYFLFVMAMIGGAMAIAGVGGGLKALDKTSEQVALMAVGLVAFCLFFPWFTCLYFARHLLGTLEKLEKEADEMRSLIEFHKPGET